MSILASILWIESGSQISNALALNRVALGFQIFEVPLVHWPKHAGYRTPEGRALTSATDAGDNLDDWYVSETPVDLMKISEFCARPRSRIRHCSVGTPTLLTFGAWLRSAVLEGFISLRAGSRANRRPLYQNRLRSRSDGRMEPRFKTALRSAGRRLTQQQRARSRPSPSRQRSGSRSRSTVARAPSSRTCGARRRRPCCGSPRRPPRPHAPHCRP